MREPVVRGIVLVVCVAVLAAACVVALATDGALRWVAALVALAAAFATLVSAVRLFATLSLLRHPPRR
jgi:hypothetical protein